MIGVAQLGLMQGCTKPVVDGESRNPGEIGLKSWNPTKKSLTLPRKVVLPEMVLPEMVQSGTEPVGGAPCEEQRPAGQQKQDGGTQQGLVNCLEDEEMISVSLAAAVTVTSHLTKPSLECKVIEGVSLKLQLG